MSDEDMFASTQQTPVTMKAPSTPSMTPTRSVKRRSNFVNRQSNIPIAGHSASRSRGARFHMNVEEGALKREAVSCFSQPANCEDFYDLRTRQVPLSSGDLWAPYGIRDPPWERDVHPEEEQNLQKDEKANTEASTRTREKLSKYLAVLQLMLLMVLSAFLGALCYAFVQHHFLSGSHSFPPQIAEDSERDRPTDTKSQPHHLENSVIRLFEDVKYLKDLLSRLQESVGSQVLASPQRGILEELLTADLACAGNFGTVLATPDTTTVSIPATMTLLGYFSFDVQMNHKSPHTTIQGLIQEAGDCWPFEGSQGRLVLKLHRRSVVTGVSISHIPPSISANGDISSAPRFFQIVVHEGEDLKNSQILGEFEYKSSGAWRQTFPLDTKEELFDIIEFRFLKNHGNANYTCIYRVHVHGRTP